MSDIDQEWIDLSYEKLKGFFVELDANPIELGPQRLIEKVERVRAFQNAVETMHLQAMRDLTRVQALRNREEGIFNIQRDHLLTSDLQVRAGRSQSDRMAMVNVKLRPILEKIEEYRQHEQALKAFLEVVSRRQTSLSQTNSQINTHVRLLEKDWSIRGGQAWRPSEEAEGPSLMNIDDLLAQEKEVDDDLEAFAAAIDNTVRLVVTAESA